MDATSRLPWKTRGEGFNWRDRIEQPLDLEGSQERGRGISMTRIFTEKLFYNDRGNQAVIIVPIRSADV